jgi:L-threonylcarbamoyladenylate synthase
VTEIVSVEQDGEKAARWALEECVWDGGVAIFPADTVYGLACDPLSESAVARIDRLKGREPGKSSAVMYFSLETARELIRGLGPRAGEAVGALLPGPVTLVLANPDRRYPFACREDPEKLGIRLIEGPLAGMPLPVLQSSANHSGYSPPVSFEQIESEILDGADVAIDGGALGGEASTVVDLSEIDEGGDWRVLREGALSRADVARRLAEAGV